ncbi:hypothetical protein FOQG_14630 [Fusarium oxysporum f. sp. raphani 54005]|uniref:Uncharacterized protein n=2 Tax=Fusarium oxysporum TaxID=5507 RepID=X0BPN3_FUSOX|nr:hypothetical protein FOMG_17112 [Fusarium oxysporum f. sp. melonis 26406]EXK80858.1 hypothetical protein FOQG_14630 [Fusarium oxysporum f. sp. raphani 54005]
MNGKCREKVAGDGKLCTVSRLVNMDGSNQD